MRDNDIFGNAVDTRHIGQGTGYARWPGDGDHLDVQQALQPGIHNESSIGGQLYKEHE